MTTLMRRLGRVRLAGLLSLALGGVVVCPPAQPVQQPQPLGRGLAVIATQMVRPLYDTSARSNLYISGYAGRRPAPPVLTPTGLRQPLGGRFFGPRPQGY